MQSKEEIEGIVILKLIIIKTTIKVVVITIDERKEEEGIVGLGKRKGRNHPPFKTKKII
jgi:hypothetical protein